MFRINCSICKSLSFVIQLQLQHSTQTFHQVDHFLSINHTKLFHFVIIKKKNINSHSKNNMLIQHRQYIALLDEIEYLKKDNTLFRQQNSILTQQLVKQKQRVQQLSEHHRKNLKLIEQLHTKSVTHHSDNTKHIISRMAEHSNQTKQFLDHKLKTLQNLTCTQNKEAELKFAKNKIDIYELNDFANKIRAIHKEVQSFQCSHAKKLSLPELIKWIKGLALICLTQQRLGLTQSTSSTNMKKQGMKSSKLKENKSVLNCSQSKQKSIVY